MVATPYLIDAIAPGFHGEKRELTIRLVRILFPGAGLLVFSAWCLGILNSHRRFFLSYTAPVIWNAAMIATLWGFGGRYAQYPLAAILAWGSVVGSALQVAVQLPVVLRLLADLQPSLSYQTENVKTVVHNFVPGFRGPRRRADQRIRGRVARQLARHRRALRVLLRADSFHPAREPVRHVGFGSRTAAHVRRDRRRKGSGRSASRARSIPACARSRFSWCRRWSRFWCWET